MKDLHNRIKCSRGISPAAATTDNTAYVSQIVDTANFDSTEFVGQLGALSDADTTLTVLVEDGDVANLSDNSAVDDAYLLGVEAMALQFDSDNKTFKIGYKGTKRYVRVTITPGEQHRQHLPRRRLDSVRRALASAVDAGRLIPISI
jgi:hypothetical protein